MAAANSNVKLEQSTTSATRSSISARFCRNRFSDAEMLTTCCHSTSGLQHREAVYACATQLREPSLKGRYTFASSLEDAESTC